MKRYMNCDVCGEKAVSNYQTTTLLGFISPAGHNHDDNCVNRVYICQNGHKANISKQNSCPVKDCDWVGIDECFCHKGKKVKEWPVYGDQP